MARYRLTGSVDPTSRIGELEYAPGKTLVLGGESQTLTDKQLEKARRYVVLEEVDENGEPVVQDPPGEAPGGAKPTAGTSGSTPGRGV